MQASGEAAATATATAAATTDADANAPERPLRPPDVVAAAAVLQQAASAAAIATAAPPAPVAFGFDLELMRAAERSRHIIDQLGGVAALAKVEGGLLTFQPTGSEYLAVPMEPAVSSGQHTFTFCVRRDSNDGSGVGLIADGRESLKGLALTLTLTLTLTRRESCLKGLGFPNNGQHGIWWLRRFCSQAYSA